MAAELSGAQRETLRAICDTVVPSIRREPDPDGFWARCGSDVGADLALAELIAALPPEQLSGTLQLLDAPRRSGVRERLAALAGADHAQHLPARRRGRGRGRRRSSPAASSSPTALPDETTGQNPFWKTFGYPGPIAAPLERAEAAAAAHS